MPASLLGVMHVNLNCRSLERSLAFYRDTLGLTPISHTKPVPQDGTGFGLEGEVQWDAHLLHDARGIAGPALDLLEWQVPKPGGAPPRALHALGISRLIVRAADPVQVAASSGGEAEAWGDATLVRDPDGIAVELHAGDAPRIDGVVVHCASLDRSIAWYQSALGLELREGPVERSIDGGHEPRRMREATLVVPGQAERFGIRLVEWQQPRAEGQPPTRANQVGPYRMAFLVEDAHAASDALRAEGHACTGPVWLEMGPEIPIDGLWASFFPDPDGACLEFIQAPTLDPAPG